MKSIVENTPYDSNHIEKYREFDDQLPLDYVRYNVQAQNLINELIEIRDKQVLDIEDVHLKIIQLTNILIRGIRFKNL